MAAVVFFAIIIFTLLCAVYAKSGSKTMNVEQYLVGGRSFGAILLFFLAVGEAYSIGTMIGFPGGIYAKGPSYGLWFLGYILLAYPIGYVVGPLIWRAGKRYNAMTLPDLFKGHFSHRGLELVITISALIFMIPWAQMQFEGLSVALQALGVNLSPKIAIIIAGCIAFTYVSVSGVKAPAIISIIKDILMFGAIIIVGVTVYLKIGGTSHLFSLAKEQGVPVTMANSKDAVFSTTTIFFQSLVFYLSPLLVPLFFTSRSEACVKRTQTFMPLYMLMYPFLVITSYFALISIPNLKQPNYAFMAATMDLLPPWAIGLVAAGGALSGILVLSVSSLAIGAMVTRNLFKNISESSQVKKIKLVIALYLIVSMAVTMLAPSLMLTLINTAYYGNGQLIPAFLALFFFRKFTPVGLAAGIIVGDVAAITMQLTNFSLFNINIGLIALALNFIVTFTVSSVFKANHHKIMPPIVHSDQKIMKEQNEDYKSIISN